MSFQDYLLHYLSIPDLLKFLGISGIIVLTLHLILLIGGRIHIATRRHPKDESVGTSISRYMEMYYELMFSSTSILFFTGLYFLLEFNYFNLPWIATKVWKEYSDFILLGFIIVSIIFIGIMDHVILPLKKINRDERATLRMAGMLYMLIIFAYIKFIYNDNNYDSIINYFILMVIGRFVYFDASFRDFKESIHDLGRLISILLLVLLSSAVIAWVGFGSGYLLRDNGVVGSLWLAHMAMIFWIFLLARLRLVNLFIPKEKNPVSPERYERYPYDSSDDYSDNQYPYDSSDDYSDNRYPYDSSDDYSDNRYPYDSSDDYSDDSYHYPY
jgi:hypothetical protein